MLRNWPGFCRCCGPTPATAQPIPDKEAIAKTAQKAMAATGARGLAIATIDKGKVVSVQAFGVRNAKGDPLTPQTIMRMAHR